MMRCNHCLLAALGGGLAAAGCGDGGAGSSEPVVTIEYIAHAAFRITSPGGSRILIDPYGSRVWIGYDFPDGIATDAIFVSHPHYDHDAGVSRGQAFPWDSTTTPLHRDPGIYRVGDVTVTGIRGKHADPYGMEFGQINTLWLIEAAGVRIGHWGDNGPVTDAIVAAMGRVDILMLPIDEQYHIIDQPTIDEILARLSPKRLVPMHYALPQLEPGDLPSGLGPIEPWLSGRGPIDAVGGASATFALASLGDSMRIVVFEPGACPQLATRC